MITGEHLQIVSDFLTELARTLAVIAIAQRLSEASTEDERIFLSQALSSLIGNFQAGRQRLNGNPHSMPFGGNNNQQWDF